MTCFSYASYASLVVNVTMWTNVAMLALTKAELVKRATNYL